MLLLQEHTNTTESSKLKTQIDTANEKKSQNNANETINTTFEAFINAIITAIETRDPSTAGHSTRVANYTKKTALAINAQTTGHFKEITFTKDQIDELHYAALLHDIGKLGIPEHILLKAEKCHPEHFNTIIQKSHHFEEAQCNEILLKHIHSECNTLQKTLEKCNAIRLKYKTFREALVKLQTPNTIPSIEDIVIIEQIAKTTLAHNPNDPLMTPHEEELFKITKGSLTTDERRLIETHPLLSYTYLSQIPWPEKWKNIPIIAARHHEKLNGTGYPHALTEENISLQTRIITICDIYDALTGNDRPYKMNHSQQNALNILREEAENHAIDQNVLDIFINHTITPKPISLPI